MDIVVIGSGNVAHYFSHILRLNGHQIRQVISRKEEHARTLAESLNTSWTTDMKDIDMNADIYLLAVSDDAIGDLNKKLYLGKRIVAHTAGAVALNAISEISINIGVIYPLQSFRKGIHVNHKIPLLIEAANAMVLKRIRAIADAIADNVIEMDSVSRLKMHLAAVFCNNFSNHLMVLCKKYCDAESLDFSLLQPLMKETFRRLENMDPDELQTGPAIRGDEETMMKHLYLLKSYPETRKVYQLLSESIEKYSSNQS